jgi:hypothetical protein
VLKLVGVGSEVLGWRPHENDAGGAAADVQAVAGAGDIVGALRNRTSRLMFWAVESAGVALAEWISCGVGRADGYTSSSQQSRDRHSRTLRGRPDIDLTLALSFRGCLRFSRR